MEYRLILATAMLLLFIFFLVVIVIPVVRDASRRTDHPHESKEKKREVVKYATPLAFDDRIFLCRTIHEVDSIKKVIESNLKIPNHLWQPQEVMQLIQLTRCKTPDEEIDSMHHYYALRYMESLVMYLNWLNNELIEGNDVEENTRKRDKVYQEIRHLYSCPLGWVQRIVLSRSKPEGEEEDTKDDSESEQERRVDTDEENSLQKAMDDFGKRSLPGSEEDFSEIFQKLKFVPPSATDEVKPCNGKKVSIDADSRLLHDLQNSNAINEGKKDPPREWTKGK